MSRNNNNNILRYKKPLRLNVGMIAFAIIFIYVIIICIMYFQKERVSIYEVVETSIADDNTCKGIILRNEKIIKTDKAGYVSYYFGEGERIAKDSTVYTLDENGDLYEMLSDVDTEGTMTSNDSRNIRNNIAELNQSFDGSDYTPVEDFKYNIENTILEFTNEHMMSQLNDLLKENGKKKSFKVVKASKSGIITYSQDGFENKKASDITADDFNQSNYHRIQLRTNEQIPSGNAVYKVVSDEDWSVVIELTPDQFEKLHEKETDKETTTPVTTITFLKNNLTTTVEYQTFQKEDGYFAELKLSRYMVQFINDRFVDVELSVNSAKGLKIPNTSVIEKEFYLIPTDYFTEGGDSEKKGLVKEVYDEKGNLSLEFVVADNYYEKDGYAYVNADLFENGEWIQNEKTSERYQLSKTAKLQGAYNVNQGYSIFKRIEILYQNEEYCIIKKNSTNGLAVFDHIIVDAQNINDEEIINKYKNQ